MSEEGANPTKIASRRRRNEHGNSHSGCLTCKQRRLKCDEGEPVCRRCRIAGRECKTDPRVWKKALRPRTYGSNAGALTASAQDYTTLCLQHFIEHTLPAFRRSEPSILWTYMDKELPHSKEIRCMATALGHEHRMAAHGSSILVEKTPSLYIEAVAALRRSIPLAENGQTSKMIFIIVFNSLLLVILQCFRKAFDDLNIHLQHGLRIASQAVTSSTDDTAAHLEACFRMLKQYSIAMALFNPLLPQDAVFSGMATATANQALNDPDSLKKLPDSSSMSKGSQFWMQDEEQNLLLDLIRTTVTQRKPHMEQDIMGKHLYTFSASLNDGGALLGTVSDLRARHAALAQAVSLYKARAKTELRARYFEMAEVRVLLMGIYLRRRWSGYACAFDVEFDTFKSGIDKIQSLLEREGQNANVDSSVMGLGLIGTIFYAAIICRHSPTRRQALALFKKCPQQDGPWNAKLAEQICRTIIDREEQLAEQDGPGYQLTGHIPEHCRILHYYYYTTEVTAARPRGEYLRVFRRLSANESFTGEDLPLGGASQDTAEPTIFAEPTRIAMD